MSAMDIEWHENNLKNMRDTTRALGARSEIARRKFVLANADVSDLYHQIERAKKAGKTKFDSDRY